MYFIIMTDNWEMLSLGLSKLVLRAIPSDIPLSHNSPGNPLTPTNQPPLTNSNLIKFETNNCLGSV